MDSPPKFFWGCLEAATDARFTALPMGKFKDAVSVVLASGSHHRNVDLTHMFVILPGRRQLLPPQSNVTPNPDLRLRPPCQCRALSSPAAAKTVNHHQL